MSIVIAALRPFVWLFCRIVFRIRFYGTENIPADGPCIIIPNHVTFIDPIWVNIPVKRRLYFMAWDRLFEIPGLGLLMKLFGAFPVKLDGTDRSAQRAAIQVLRSGEALGVFSEGGRTRTGKVMPFKMGAFRLALTHGAPIIPVTIEGAHKVWPFGKILPRPGKLRITYHPPIPVERLPDSVSRLELKAQARLIAERTRQVVARGLGEILDDTATVGEQTDGVVEA
jgi:1-acyl-sn-glycerol-3-phosphate acyltransferase